MRKTIGVRNTAETSAIARPVRKESMTPVDATTLASSTFFCPSRRAMMLPEPMPYMKPNAWMMDIKPKTMPTAPLALVPSVPTNAVSTRL